MPASEREDGADPCAPTPVTLRRRAAHVLIGEDMHGRWQIAPGELQLTGAGRPFVRIAAVFVDHRHPTRQPARPIFSKAS